MLLCSHSAMPNAPPWSTTPTFTYAFSVQIIKNISLAGRHVLLKRTKSLKQPYVPALWYKKAEELWTKAEHGSRTMAEDKLLLALRGYWPQLILI